MPITQKDTKTLVNAVVKALDPKFKRIDERFEQVDKRFEQVDKNFEQVDKNFEQFGKQFKDMNLEIGGMIRQLATKDELHKEISRLDVRMDEVVERYNEFTGDMTVFQSNVWQRFGHLDEKLQEHDGRFEMITGHVKETSGQMNEIRHDHQEQNKLIKLAIDRIGNVSKKVSDHEGRIDRIENAA